MGGTTDGAALAPFEAERLGTGVALFGAGAGGRDALRTLALGGGLSSRRPGVGTPLLEEGSIGTDLGVTITGCCMTVRGPCPGPRGVTVLTSTGRGDAHLSGVPSGSLD